jgi:acetyl esterase
VPLDPTARPIVDAMTANFPRLGTDVLDAAVARQLIAANAPPPRPVPRPMARIENFTIAGPAAPIPVRAYWPVSTPEPLATVAFFHGGGFVICDLDTHDDMCRAIAGETGALVVSVDYRLAPEHRYPAAAEDAYAATKWIAEHAESLGGDAGRLVVAGDSAGGNLAAVAALMARDRGGPGIAFQLLIYPVIDAAQDTASYQENSDGYFLTAAYMRWFWEQYLGPHGDPRSPYASPIRCPDLSGLPPAHIVTAECDPLRDEGEAYGRALEQAGVPATVVRYEGMFHGFFGMAELLPRAQAANDQAFDAVRRALAALAQGA